MNTQAALVSALQGVGAQGVIDALRAAVLEAYPASDLTDAQGEARAALIRAVLGCCGPAIELDAETI
jgi:hypothetical protein